jgi:hypothetical protein
MFIYYLFSEEFWSGFGPTLILVGGITLAAFLWWLATGNEGDGQ